MGSLAVSQGIWLAVAATITAVGSIVAALVATLNRGESRQAHADLLDVVLDMHENLGAIRTETAGLKEWTVSHNEQDLRVAEWLGVPDKVIRGNRS